MINTYEAYLEQPDCLKIEDALNIYKHMTECIGKCTMEDKMEFWNEFLEKAGVYTEIRNRWEFMSREERIEADRGRSLTHDGFITSINVLARIAEQEGLDNSWREKLGDARKRIGDYACFVTYITGISNR